MGQPEQLDLPPPTTTPRRRPAWMTIGRVAVVCYLAGVLAPRAWNYCEQSVTQWTSSSWSDAAHSSHGHGHGHKHKHISLADAEKIYLKVPSNESLYASSHKYTAHAHPAGSGWDFVTALQVKNDWERALGLPETGPTEKIYEAGSAESQHALRQGKKLDVWIDTYFPVMNTPVSSSVALLTEPVYRPKLREAVLEGDPYSVLADEVRSFHGLSVDGHVSAEYVYAGYGRKSDFDLLQSKGIDFNGKVVLVKYGGVFRGLKVKAAQEAGAAAVIIFTDPGDDGDIQETKGYKPYPEGPARVPSSVQRGSVQFLSKYPGDPTTPGIPAYRNATRTPGGNFPSIPSLPMSYEDVIPILKHLNGQGLSPSDLDASFDGGLRHKGVEYFTGPSKTHLHVVNRVNTRVMPVWNVMARIPGDSRETIVMGNHRDAWVLGASDPNAGSASQTELAKGLGVLLNKGWTPQRTILLASWDAEEYGLIGSTEFAEDFEDWIKANVAAYLNLDSSVSGQHFRAGASPSLAHLVQGAAKKVQRGDKSVWDTRLPESEKAALGVQSSDLRSQSVAQLGLSNPRTEAEGGTGVRPLGSGSDYTAFLQRCGVASIDFGYGSSLQSPVYHYHSVYDNLNWMKMFGDPTFQKHKEASQILGLLVLRLSEQTILPLNTTQYTHDLYDYYVQVREIRDAAGLDVQLENLENAIGRLGEASVKLDGKRAELEKKLRKRTEDIHNDDDDDEEELEKRAESELVEDAEEHRDEGHGDEEHGKHKHKHHKDKKDKKDKKKDKKKHKKHDKHKHHKDKKGNKKHKHKHGKDKQRDKKLYKAIAEVNYKLRKFESGFISKHGIPDREWYKHLVVAPGKWLGYGATTFPALTEAIIFDHDVGKGQFQADLLAGLLNALAEEIER